MSALASQCEAHVKSFCSGKNPATRDEEASVRQDDLLIVLQLCANSHRAGHQYGVTIMSQRVPGVSMHVGRAHKTPWVQELAQNMRKRPDLSSLQWRLLYPAKIMWQS